MLLTICFCNGCVQCSCKMISLQSEKFKRILEWGITLFRISIMGVQSVVLWAKLDPRYAVWALSKDYRPVILANIWVKPTTNCYRNEKCIFEIYNPICISEKKSSNVA